MKREEEETSELLFKEGTGFYQAGREQNGVRRPGQGERRGRARARPVRFSVLRNTELWGCWGGLENGDGGLEPCGLTRTTLTLSSFRQTPRNKARPRKPGLHPAGPAWKGRLTSTELTLKQVTDAIPETREPNGNCTAERFLRGGDI